MKKKRWTGWIVLSAIAILYTLGGCNEYTLLGDDMTGGSGNNKTLKTDTFTIKTYNTFKNQDSVYSTASTNVTVGTINDDPVFGKTVSSVYFQLGLAKAEASFSGPDPVLDSVVLSLRYAGHYGDSLGAQSYTAYQITDPSFSDTTLKYYIHQKFDIDEALPLGTAHLTPKSIADSVKVIGIKEPAQLRIRLSDDFGNKLLSQNADGALASDSSFHQWLNGIALIPDSTTAGRKSLMYFELNNKYTGISLYYHNSKEDSLYAYFPFKVNSGVWSNYRKHDFTGTPVESALQNGVADSVIYLESNSGLYTDIIIPYLEDLPDALINKAELIITQTEDASNQIFQTPYELFLWQYSNKARDSIGYLIDVGATFNQLYGWQFTNLQNFGGLKESITNKEGKKVAQYRFTITRYVQHLISGSSRKETNYGFRLGILDPLDRGINVGRVTLGGGQHAEYSMKLRIIYSEIQ